MKSILTALIVASPALVTAEPVSSSAAPGTVTPASDARAAIAAEPDDGAKSRLTLNLGLFTPTGEFGAEYTRNVASFFEVGVGVGAGWSGAQASVMPRLRAGNGGVAVLLGAGVSGGQYREPVLFCWGEDGNCMGAEAIAMWANIEGAVQLTASGGTSVTLYGGLGLVTAATDCAGRDCDDIVGTKLPYVGIAIGHTL